jgi:hypothetical protein
MAALSEKEERNMRNRVTGLQKKGSDLTNLFGVEVFILMRRPPYGQWALKPENSDWPSANELVCIYLTDALEWKN